jgi:hypothetical protein
MSDFNDIQALWQTAEVNNLPSTEEIMKIIKKYRLKQVIKKLALIVFNFILLGVMIKVILEYNSTFLSTTIGEALLILSILFLIGTNAMALKRVAAQKDSSNEEFIKFLKVEQQHLMAFYKRTQQIGLAIASSGLGLYIFEEIRHDTTWLIIGYSLFLVYALACWFILRPLFFRKKTKRLNLFITKLEKISSQFSND